MAGIASAEHCAFCFESLTAHLNGRPLPQPGFEDGNCALFVTWTKASASSTGAPGRLRGCIGTLEPRRLHTALRDYALTSALRDSRFAPIAARELPHLTCGVSLLRHFETAEGWEDWEVGTHGLIIEFTDPRMRCRRTATFLPEVAGEQGWDRQQTIDALIRKAGFEGRVDDALRSSLRVTRYQSSKAKISYSEFTAHGGTCRDDARAEGAKAGEAGAAADVATVFA